MGVIVNVNSLAPHGLSRLLYMLQKGLLVVTVVSPGLVYDFEYGTLDDVAIAFWGLVLFSKFWEGAQGCQLSRIEHESHT